MTKGKTPKKDRTTKPAQEQTLHEKEEFSLEPPCMDNSVRRGVCLELLISGHVNAFVELYQVSESAPGIQQSEADLRLLQRELSAAEQAARASNNGECFLARRRLAEAFQTAGSEDVSQHFWDSCLQYSKNLGDGGAQIAETYRAIGVKMEEEGNLVAANDAFENMYRISKNNNLASELTQACRACSRVAIAIAAKSIEAGDHATGRQCLAAAGERATEGAHVDLLCIVAYYLGVAAEALGELEPAVKHLEEYLATPTEEPAMLHNACMVLGRCHQALGDSVMAGQYYRRLADVSATEGNHEACADACMRLGHMLSAEGDHRGAVDWFSKSHTEALQTSDVTLQAAVRVNFGLARARALMPSYTKATVRPEPAAVNRLLDWKSTRADTFSNGGGLIFDMLPSVSRSAAPRTASTPATATAAHAGAGVRAVAAARTVSIAADPVVAGSFVSGDGLSEQDAGTSDTAAAAAGDGDGDSGGVLAGSEAVVDARDGSHVSVGSSASLPVSATDGQGGVGHSLPTGGLEPVDEHPAESSAAEVAGGDGVVGEGD